ncbi:hypothetical protein GRW75_14425 [Escherichia coli]|nr:hypothetical protein [Escherichia coli]
MMSLWDALRMNMMISYQELVRTFPKKPLLVNITGEATVRPDEPAFFTFNQSANDQFTQDMLLSSSYPEEE